MPHVRSKDTVDSALRASDAGVPDAVKAARHDVAVKTIRRWRREYQRKGRPRGQQHLAPPCPRCDGAPLDHEAYAEMLGWYLGDGYLSTGPRDVFNLHIYNDVQYTHDNEQILALMRRVSHVDVRTRGGSPARSCSRGPGSTGRACFHSTDPAESTSVRSCSRPGKRSS